MNKILLAILLCPLTASAAGFSARPGYSTIQQSGTPLAQRLTLNFTGAGVTCVDDGANSRTTCTVTSGGGGTPGGADTNVQYNDGGTFGGDAHFTWAKTSREFQLVAPDNIGIFNVSFDANFQPILTAGVTLTVHAGDGFYSEVTKAPGDWTDAHAIHVVGYGPMNIGDGPNVDFHVTDSTGALFDNKPVIAATNNDDTRARLTLKDGHGAVTTGWETARIEISDTQVRIGMGPGDGTGAYPNTLFVDNGSASIYSAQDYGTASPTHQLRLFFGLPGSATPGVAGDGTQVKFRGNDDGGNPISYSMVQAEVLGATATNPTGLLKLAVPDGTGPDASDLTTAYRLQLGPSTLGWYHGAALVRDLLGTRSLTAAADVTANQGTTTTLLHGNAAGQPSFGNVTGSDFGSNILDAAHGGTGNGFFAVSGPATPTKTFTFPNASATVLTSNALVTEAQGGTGAGALTCTNQFITSNGTAYSCATDTLASAQHANQGTTTTVLHGAAAGNPTWASVDLSADTAATVLPATKGGTGANLTGNTGGVPFFSSSTVMTQTAGGAVGTMLYNAVANTPSWVSLEHTLWSWWFNAAAATGSCPATGTGCTGHGLPARAFTVTTVTGMVSVVSGGGAANTVFTITDGTNTCTATFACNTVTNSTGVKRVTTANGAGTGCAYAANALLTISVTTAGCTTTQPTFRNVDIAGNWK